MSIRRRASGFPLRCLAVATSCLLATGAYAADAGAEWNTPSGSLQGTRYSTLNEITPSTVGRLVEEFSYSTGSHASHEGQPLVVGSTMYVVTPFPNKLVALNLAKGGAVSWTFKPSYNEFARGVACCDLVNRGAAYSGGTVVFTSLDGSVYGVNASTGKQIWKAKLGNPTAGETLTGAPLIVNSKVIVGNAGGELGVRGWIQGLDLKTGKILWKAYNTGPDADVKISTGVFNPYYAKDRGTDLGSTSWPSSLWQQGGATAWAWLTYDPGLNLLYYGTSNPGVWNPTMRPGDNKWGATIFARNPDTGAAVWAYQLTPHDGWDYDAVNESIVADLPINGSTRKVIVHFNKNGFAYTLDRATGQVLVAEKFVKDVTWASSIDKSTGLPSLNPDKQPAEGVITSGICPSPLGGKDWEPSAYSPSTGLFYIPAINFCDTLEPLKAVYIAGTPFMGADVDFAPTPSGSAPGELIAWNASTGQRAWSLPEPAPLYGGVLATAGNLVVYGTLDRYIKAVNATTGELVFKKQLECGVVGAPMSYKAPDGHQRIAVYTGVGWLAGGFAGGQCPGSSGSGKLHVFKLQ